MGWFSERPHAIKTFLFLVGSELMFLALFAGTVEFHPDLYSANSTTGTPQNNLYPYWQDIHVMMYVGFGFLLVFPHAYSWGAVAFNMLMAAYGFQWALLCNGFFWWIFKQNMHGYLELNIFELINAEVGVASVLIAYSAIVGKFSPLQYLFMTFCQIFLWSLNIYFCYFLYAAQDAGGAMVIHVFGAFFGLAVSWVNTARAKKKPMGHPGWTSSYNSDTFAMIGSLFLWMFWPSFNSALAIEGGQNRAAINTVLSIASSCLLAFAWSFLIRGKISMFDIQNATLAGGVGMGAACDLSLEPWGAILVGFVAGSVSALGYIYALPFLEKYLKLHDSAGIFNLHGLPGIIGGLASIFVSLSVQGDTIHGWPAGKIYLSRAPEDPDAAAAMGLAPGLGRSANQFAAYQAATLATSLGMGIIGGIGTGLLMRLPFCDAPHYDEYFLDRKYFEHHEDLDNQTVELAQV